MKTSMLLLAVVLSGCSKPTRDFPVTKIPGHLIPERPRAIGGDDEESPVIAIESANRIKEQEKRIKEQEKRIKELESLVGEKQREEMNRLEEAADSWKRYSWKQGQEINDLRKALGKAIDKKPVAEVTKGIRYYDAKYEQMGVNGRDSGYVLAPSVLGDFPHSDFPNRPILVYNGTAWHVPSISDETWNTEGSLLAVATAKPGEPIKTIQQWMRVDNRWEEVTADSWSEATIGVLRTDRWTINGKTYRLVEESDANQEGGAK